MKKVGKSQWKGFLFLAPSLAGVSLFVLLPFLDVVRRSFGEAVTGKFVGIQNYLAVFENTAFRLASWNTLRFVGICIPLLLALSLASALLLSSKMRGETSVEKHFSPSHGDSRCICGFAVAAFFSLAGIIQWNFKLSASLRGELDEFPGCFRSFGIQLYMEKSGI